jgi:hypothetical protein
MPKRSNVSRKLKRGRNKKQTKKCKSGGGKTSILTQVALNRKTKKRELQKNKKNKKNKENNENKKNPNIPLNTTLKRPPSPDSMPKAKRSKQSDAERIQVEEICKCDDGHIALYCCFNKNMVEPPKTLGKGGQGTVYYDESQKPPIAYKVVDLGLSNTTEENKEFRIKYRNFFSEVNFASKMGSLNIGPLFVKAFINKNKDDGIWKGVLVMERYTMSLHSLFNKMREEPDSYKPDVIQNIGQIVFNIMKKMAGSGHMCGDVKAANFVVNLDETDKKDKKVIDGRMIDFGVGPKFCNTYIIDGTYIIDKMRIKYTPELLTYAMAYTFRYNTIMNSYHKNIKQFDILPGLERGVYSDKKLIDDKTLTDLNSILHAQPFYSNMHHYTKDALEKINKKLIDEDKPKNESKNKLNNEPKNESKNKLNNQPKNELNNQPNNQSNNETMKKPIKKPMKKLEKDIILEITKNMIDKYINGIADGILSVEPLESVKLKLITISDGINTVNISNTVNTAPMANTVNTAPMSNTVSTAPMANTVPTASMASTVPTASMANTEPMQIDT